jgi:hypothetical protein
VLLARLAAPLPRLTAPLLRENGSKESSPTAPSAPVGSPTLVAAAPMAFVLFRVREDEEGQLDVKN